MSLDPLPNDSQALALRPAMLSDLDDIVSVVQDGNSNNPMANYRFPYR